MEKINDVLESVGDVFMVLGSRIRKSRYDSGYKVDVFLHSVDGNNECVDVELTNSFVIPFGFSNKNRVSVWSVVGVVKHVEFWRCVLRPKDRSERMVENLFGVRIFRLRSGGGNRFGHPHKDFNGDNVVVSGRVKPFVSITGSLLELKDGAISNIEDGFEYNETKLADKIDVDSLDRLRMKGYWC